MGLARGKLVLGARSLGETAEAACGLDRAIVSALWTRISVLCRTLAIIGREWTRMDGNWGSKAILGR